ncbi:hypothetical protein F5Y04DRAFT_281008 [Hypomontagnella monticulosa]|nr:hypothetical protein F5Y04DRAFT_281008 [Hypomontagnella monticulosa]
MSSAIFLEEPPGISHVALMSIQWSGTGFCLMVIAVRLAIRWKIFSRLKIDDYFAVVGALLNLASSILWTIIGNSFYGILDGSDESMTSQRALGEVGLILRGHLIGAALMWSCLWSIKLSFMAFFHGLGSRIKSQRILWWSILVFVVISYVICISVLDYQCIASKGSEISKNCPSSHVAGREYAGTRVTTSLDIATDVASKLP